MNNNTQIKERPILFSTPMVRAILDGRKTMTRRVVKTDAKRIQWNPIIVDGHAGYCDEHGNHYKCPYGAPGDRLYVKETFFAYGRWIKEYNTIENRDKWFFQDMVHLEGKMYQYADSPPKKVEQKRVENVVGWYKRPSLFMPYYASRILLEITDARVERLQEISEEDAISEGVQKAFGPNWVNYTDENYTCGKASVSFLSLWEKINGQKSLSENTFVWVITFKKI